MGLMREMERRRPAGLKGAATGRPQGRRKAPAGARWEPVVTLRWLSSREWLPSWRRGWRRSKPLSVRRPLRREERRRTSRLL